MVKKYQEVRLCGKSACGRCVSVYCFLYTAAAKQRIKISLCNQIKHMESEMEQLREENERLKKLLGETS
jgi:hypothetical protein